MCFKTRLRDESSRQFDGSAQMCRLRLALRIDVVPRIPGAGPSYARYRGLGNSQTKTTNQETENWKPRALFLKSKALPSHALESSRPSFSALQLRRCAEAAPASGISLALAKENPWTPNACRIIVFYRSWAIILPTFGGLGRACPKRIVFGCRCCPTVYDHPRRPKATT